MLGLYRRHEPDCKYRKKGVRHTTCACPVWCDGYVQGDDPNIKPKRIRHSMHTRSWDTAHDRLKHPENYPPLPSPTDSPTVAVAVESYIKDCETRNLAEASLKRYRTALEPLGVYFPGKVNTITFENLSAFRAARAVVAGASAANELAMLRTFMTFTLRNKWITENPALYIKPPKIETQPTMPFSSAEVTAILAACDNLPDDFPQRIERTRLRAKALALVMLYSGFRISDAVKLERSSLDLNTGKLLVRVMKTKQPLYAKLPEDALNVLRSLPIESPYFFWNGKSNLATAINTARNTIHSVLKLAKVKDGHPHRFRDTFSVELLKNGTDIRTVQLLLGHSSVVTTEKHYAPYVQGMQKALDTAVATLNFTA